MKRNFHIFLILALASFLTIESALCQNDFIKTNYFSFYNPSVRRDAYSRDSNVYEKMMYYGYRTSMQPTDRVLIALRYYKQQGAFNNLQNEAAFDAVVTQAINFFKNYLDSFDRRYLPPRESERYASIYDKLLVLWNTNHNYCYMYDSLTYYPGADKKSKAIEMNARFISACDTLVRGWYGCDSVIHQVCEEMAIQWLDYGGSFISYAQGDSVAGYKLFFSVINSIAGAVLQKVPNKSKTAIEWYYGQGPTQERWGDPTNSQGYRSAAFDSLLNVNIFFMQSSPQFPEYVLRESNAVADSISYNGRKLGVTIYWRCIINKLPCPAPSSSSQLEDFLDASTYFTNAKYFSIVGGDCLDGLTHAYDGSTGYNFNIDATQHFRALAEWLDVRYLVLMDKFRETYVDTAWWNNYGAITADSVNSIISIGPDAYIESKVDFDICKARAVVQRSNGTATSTQEMGLFMEDNYDGNEVVNLFIKNDTAYTRIKVNGGTPTVTKYSAFGRINPSTKHELFIERSKYYADFYIDGQYLAGSYLGGLGDFNSLLKIYTTNGSGSGDSLHVDSTMVTDESVNQEVEIYLTSEQVDTIAGGARPAGSFQCKSPSRVEGWLLGPSYEDGVPYKFYDSYTSITSGSASVEVTFPEYSCANYWIVFIAINASRSDTVIANSFYLLEDSTILAGSENTATIPLPRTYSLAQNDPNPFNPSTTINYSIPEYAAPANVNLVVFNIRGQKVVSLVNNEVKGSGEYSVVWDGTDAQGERVPSGVYFYQLNCADFVATRKMVILK